MNFKYSLIIFILILLVQPSSAWLSGFDYRAEIQINNTGIIYTGSQYNFTVDTAALISVGKMQSNGSDCWITDENDNLLNVWNETAFNLSNTNIVVNATILGNVTNTTHYMYYGNAIASSAMNIEKMAYKLGDDFSSPSTITDLLNYTAEGLYDGNNPVVPCGGATDSDKYIREIGNIIYNASEPVRKYKIVYTGYNSGKNTDEKIHYAYSIDGITWTKSTSNPVISTRAEDPYFLQNNSIYYLFAEDKAGGATDIKLWNSTDCETWNDMGVVFQPGVAGWENDDVSSPIVWIEGSTWHMIYEGRGSGSPSNGIGYATSPNGTVWARNASNPIIQSGYEFATGDVVPDDVYKNGSTYYFWYHGYDGTYYQTGMTTSTNIVDWVYYSNSPIDSDELTISSIPHTQHIFVNESIFYYWPRDDTGADTKGIYRGYPINTDISIDSSKWTIHKKGSNSAIVELSTGNLRLKGLTGTISSGSVKSIDTFTNNIVIRYNRKGTEADYRDLSIGTGSLVDLTGGTTNWYFTTLLSSYYFFEKSNAGGGRIYYMPPSGGSVEINDNRFDPIFGSYEIHEISYNKSGYMSWKKDDVLKTEATNTSYLSDAKNILITQGGHSDTRDGESFIDWFYVSKLTLPQPIASVGIEEQQLVIEKIIVVIL